MAEAASSEGNETENAMATDLYTLYSFVDEVESRVEVLRREATALIGERASLLAIMEQLKSDCMNTGISSEDCQELLTNMERLRARCEAVNIQVNTVRDEGQVQALHKVNTALSELEARLLSNDHHGGKMVQQAHSYLNACLPEALGPVDSRFQSMVLGCALDDQKDIRRRLDTLVRELSITRSENKKEKVSNTNMSNLNSASEQSEQSSSHLSSNVVEDETPSKENDVENHLKPEWFSSPKDISDDSESNSEEKNPLHPKQSHSNV